MNDRVVLNVSAIVFCAVTPLFVICRFACRKATRSIGSDDWTILAAMTVTLVINAIRIIAIDHSLGRTNEETPPEDIATKKMTHYLGMIFYKVAMSLIKVSICLLYLRIFTNKYFRAGVWLTFIVAAGWGIGATLAKIFQCSPIEKSWDPSVPENVGKCTHLKAVFYSSASVALLTDVSLLLLPIPLVKKMHRPLKDKILLYFVFGMGIIVTATTVVKILSVELQAKEREKSRTYIAKLDPITGDLGASIWGLMEVNLGVICACLPTLRSFFSRSLPRAFWRKGLSFGSFFSSSHSVDNEQNSRKPLFTLARMRNASTSADSCGEEMAITQPRAIMKKTEISTMVFEDDVVSERHVITPTEKIRGA